ncbi:SEL1-like repeat protein [Kitasatospora sp. NPDC004240]
MPNGENTGRPAALAELRRRLNDGLALASLDKTQLATRSALGRTTVQEAFRAGGPVPSAATVVALARALRLPSDELLDLRREALADPGPVPADVDEQVTAGQHPGRPIREWDPLDLEVHPAGTGRTAIGRNTGAQDDTPLPGYVLRAHDQILAGIVEEAVEGRSRMAVLVGTSSTGKTRACWEAVRPLADYGWVLWHPFDPTRADAALTDLERVGPHTVVWLNEAQHYLGDPQHGERIAAALHTLLTEPARGPVLVLGTLWPEYLTQYTALPAPAGPDRYSRVRELLTGRTVTIADTFDQDALRAATALARDGDRLLAGALTRTRDSGRLAQDLAGAPELLRRYDNASPAARALLEAAMDARRLGVGLRLPQAFLTDAAAHYLTDLDREQLTEDWAEAAYAELACPVYGKQAPLRRSAEHPPLHPPSGSHPASTPGPILGPTYRLADYLEQHGRNTRRRLCPPASFWYAAHAHLTHPDDLNNLAQAASTRRRDQWAHHLQRRAADAGHPEALVSLAWAREKAGDQEGAETLYRQAIDTDNGWVLQQMALLREKVGDREGAEALYRQAIDTDNGDSYALCRLALLREEAGDREGAEALLRQAAKNGSRYALIQLAWLREEAGDREGAEALLRQAAENGSRYALIEVAWLREEAGDREGAEALYRQAAENGVDGALAELVRLREEAGDQEGADAVYRQAAENGSPYVLLQLAWLREEAGDREGAKALYRQAAKNGDSYALCRLALLREEAGDREGAEALYRQAAENGSTEGWAELAWLREEAGDREGADAVYRQAAENGSPYALCRLAWLREEAGDREGAEALYRQAADTGHYVISQVENRWPHGLEPDGTPSAPWS